ISDIITYCSNITITNLTGITNSDHAILHTKWLLPHTFPMQRKKRTSRKTFLYYKMTEDSWADFASYISNCMTEFKLNNDTPISDEGVLNRQWYKWNMVVKEA